MTRAILVATVLYGLALGAVFYGLVAYAFGWTGPLALIGSAVCGLAAAWPTGPMIAQIMRPDSGRYVEPTKPARRTPGRDA